MRCSCFWDPVGCSQGVPPASVLLVLCTLQGFSSLQACTQALALKLVCLTSDMVPRCEIKWFTA